MEIMVIRRIIGCTVICSAILIRVFVLEAHPPPPNVEDYLYMGIWFLAPVAFVLSVIVFLILGLLKKIKLAEQSFDFLCSVVGWALGGIGIASVIIFAISAYNHGSQAPFALIFFDGPLGAGVGTVVGFVMWLLKVGENWDFGFRFR